MKILTHLSVASAVLLGVSTATVPAVASNWSVDYDQSRIDLRLTQLNQPVDATFGSWRAAIDFDPAHLEGAQVQVEVAVASFSSGAADRDKAAVSSAWLDADAEPSAIFHADTFSETDTGYRADGTLALAGATIPVSLPFQLEIDGDTARMSGEVTVNRRDFEIGVGGETDGAVGASVVISVEVIANRR